MKQDRNCSDSSTGQWERSQQLVELCLQTGRPGPAKWHGVRDGHCDARGIWDPHVALWKIIKIHNASLEKDFEPIKDGSGNEFQVWWTTNMSPCCHNYIPGTRCLWYPLRSVKTSACPFQHIIAQQISWRHTCGSWESSGSPHFYHCQNCSTWRPDHVTFNTLLTSCSRGVLTTIFCVPGSEKR
jgi:hypothetical protein